MTRESAVVATCPPLGEGRTGWMAQALEESLGEMRGVCAVTDGRQSLSYAELLTTARDMAMAYGHLLGRTPSVVAVVASRELRLVLGWVTASTWDASVVPLDISLPAERLGEAVVAAGAELILTTGSAPALLTSLERRGVRGRLLVEQFGFTAVSTGLRPAVPGDCAYAMFTSGSTGHPKGVPVKSDSLRAYLQHAAPAFGGAAGRSRHSFTFSPSFDLSVHSLWVPLLTGGTVCLPTSDHAHVLVENYIDRFALTHWFSVPSVIELALTLGSLPRGRPDSIEVSHFCGEALSWSAAQTWADTVGGQILNLYGPTELTISVSSFDLDQPRSTQAPQHPTVPLGSPYPNHEWRIVGDSTDPAQGQLVCRGPQRFDGYLGAASGVSPFISTDGHPSDVASTAESWYQTGDVVREVDGAVYYLGRLDDELKIQGVRVSLSEIRSLIDQDSNVALCAVDALSAGNGQLAVGAVLVLRRPEPISRLLARLRETMPMHMLPKALVLVSELPMLANGKVNRARVRAMITESFDGQ